MSCPPPCKNLQNHGAIILTRREIKCLQYAGCFTNLEEQQNCMIGSKVTTNLKTFFIHDELGLFLDLEPVYCE